MSRTLTSGTAATSASDRTRVRCNTPARRLAANSCTLNQRVYCAALLCLWPAVISRVAADSGTSDLDRAFGSLRDAASEVAICWEPAPEVELTPQSLRFARSGAVIRSELLPLVPLQRYRIGSTMGRGPGGTPRFAISYRDRAGNTIEWLPGWQHPNGPRADWLPLSAHAQRYVQGFVLPPGASQARLVLRLDASAKDQALARYSEWTVSDLRLDALGNVACCEGVGENLLWNGDLGDHGDYGDHDHASSDGQLKHWSHWGAAADKIELVALPDAPAGKHVVRIKPGASVHLFSQYFAPVSAGRAYRIAIKARGHGRVELDAHSLTSDRPTPLRVGNHQEGTRAIDVQTQAWRELSTVWFAEAPNVTLADVVISVWAEGVVELDAIELRPFERTQPSAGAAHEPQRQRAVVSSPGSIR